MTIRKFIDINRVRRAIGYYNDSKENSKHKGYWIEVRASGRVRVYLYDAARRRYGLSNKVYLGSVATLKEGNELGRRAVEYLRSN